MSKSTPRTSNVPQTPGGRTISNKLSLKNSKHSSSRGSLLKVSMLKNQPSKRLIAFIDEEEFNKAKACDEMLMYEKPGQAEAGEEKIDV